MTRVTDRALLPALTALWAECFGDGRDEIDAFWAQLFDFIRVYAEFSGSRAVSMVCALPTELIGEDGAANPCAYLYAVCTAPSERGKGLSRRLLQFALRDLTEAGFAFAALAPASETLYRFYAEQGFQTAFFCRPYAVCAQAAPLRLTAVTPESYRNLREMQLYGAFVSYPEALLALEGQRLYRIETADGIYCADVQAKGDTLTVRELLPDAPEIAAALAARFGCKKAAVRAVGGVLPSGMLRRLGAAPMPKAAYLPFDFG